MSFPTLENKLHEWKRATEQDLFHTLDHSCPDSFQLEEARQMEQELWLIERLRCRIFYPTNRPRQEGIVTKAFMGMIIQELAEEFIRQERYGLCFFLKIRQAGLIALCTDGEMRLRRAS